jgi:hypothetical protein
MEVWTDGHSTRPGQQGWIINLQCIQVTHFGDYAVKLNEELPILLFLSTTIKRPAFC